MSVTSTIERDLEGDIRDPGAAPQPSADRGAARSTNTRKAIMQAARESFLQHGISGTRLAAVAREAWFAPSTVSLHFKGKEALFIACLEEDVDLLFGKVTSAVKEHPYPLTSGDFSLLLGLSMSNYPLLRSVMLRSPGRWGYVYYDSPHLESVRQRMVDEIRRGQLSGQIRSDLDAAMLGRSLGSLITTAIWPVGQESQTAERQARAITSVVWMSLFHPVGQVTAILDQCRPWRLDHLELPLDINNEGLGSLSESDPKSAR